jgi:hypothetical protein
MNQVNLSKFYADGDWIIVENIIKNCFKKFAYELDESLSPEDFKAQTLANKKLIEAINEFLLESKIYTAPVAYKNPFE